jgi:hypothetical protein
MHIHLMLLVHDRSTDRSSCALERLQTEMISHVHPDQSLVEREILRTCLQTLLNAFVIIFSSSDTKINDQRQERCLSPFDKCAKDFPTLKFDRIECAHTRARTLRYARRRRHHQGEQLIEHIFSLFSPSLVFRQV